MAPIKPTSREAANHKPRKLAESELDVNRAFAIAPLFRPSFLRAVEARRHKAITRRVARNAGLSLAPDDTVQAFLLRAYAKLLKEHRGEYIFKNELLNRVLLKRHAPPQATILTEYQIAGSHSRVDLVLVNDTTTAFEVKSERDDTSRLAEQLAHSCQVFDRVYVVCAPRHKKSIASSIPHSVGMIVFEPGEGVIEEKPADSNISRLNAESIFLNLRTRDYEQIVVDHFGSLPSVQPIEQWRTCRALFASLPPTDVHAAFLGVLRNRFLSQDAGPALQGIPLELTHLYYNVQARLRSRLLNPLVLGRSAG